MRNETYLAYVAVTNDEAQRSIRPFYKAVTICIDRQIFSCV